MPQRPIPRIGPAPYRTYLNPTPRIGPAPYPRPDDTSIKAAPFPSSISEELASKYDWFKPIQEQIEIAKQQPLRKIYDWASNLIGDPTDPGNMSKAIGLISPAKRWKLTEKLLDSGIELSDPKKVEATKTFIMSKPRIMSHVDKIRESLYPGIRGQVTNSQYATDWDDALAKLREQQLEDIYNRKVGFPYFPDRDLRNPLLDIEVSSQLPLKNFYNTLPHEAAHVAQVIRNPSRWRGEQDISRYARSYAEESLPWLLRPQEIGAEITAAPYRANQSFDLKEVAPRKKLLYSDKLNDFMNDARWRRAGEIENTREFFNSIGTANINPRLEDVSLNFANYFKRVFPNRTDRDWYDIIARNWK